MTVELYENEGSVGAALGAGVGAGIYQSYNDANAKFKSLQKFESDNISLYEELYKKWKKLLESALK